MSFLKENMRDYFDSFCVWVSGRLSAPSLPNQTMEEADVAPNLSPATGITSTQPTREPWHRRAVLPAQPSPKHCLKHLKIWILVSVLPQTSCSHNSVTLRAHTPVSLFVQWYPLILGGYVSRSLVDAWSHGGNNPIYNFSYMWDKV